MLIKAILLGLVSLVAVVDSRLIGRQNIGRPLILSTLAGLVLGDMKQGIILGASLELMSMGFVAIGAAGPPNIHNCEVSLLLRLLSFRVLLQKKLCHLLFL